MSFFSNLSYVCDYLAVQQVHATGDIHDAFAHAFWKRN